MLEIKDLSKQYGSKRVFNNYSLTIAHPKTCLTGENGQGKSTLLLIIAGLANRTTGHITLNGSAIEAPIDTLGISSDSIQMPPFLKASDVIQLHQSRFEMHDISIFIEGFSLAPHLHQPIESLSAGNLRKLQLSCALAKRCDYLLLDEPNIALDQNSSQFLFEQLAHLNTPLLVTSNEPDTFSELGFDIRALHSRQQGD